MNDNPPSPAATTEPVNVPNSWSRWDWLWALVLIVAVFLVYKPAWHGGLIWDDHDYLTPPELRSAQGLMRIWSEPGATEQYYPLTHTVLWAEFQLWGETLLGYHLLNLALHSISALLLVRILHGLKVPGAWFAAFLFALHPVMVESVAWITELKNTLSCVFFLSSIMAYLKFDCSKVWGWFGLSLALFALGLLAKTTIVCLPVVLLALAWMNRGEIEWRRLLPRLAPFFMVGLVAGLFTAWVERRFIGAVGDDFQFTFIERCLIAGRAFWFYLGKLVWPVDLTFIYPRWKVSQSAWWQYLYPFMVLTLGVVLWGMRRIWRAPFAVMVIFLAALFPALGFFNVFPFRYSFVANHFQYLAAIGPLVFGAALITRCAGQRTLRALWKPAIVVVLGMLTWSQSRLYADAETLWKGTLKRNPACWLAYNNLAKIQMEQGNVPEALSNLSAGLEIEPRDVVARDNLGEALRQLGRLDEARTELQKALALDPDNPNTHYNLGVVLMQQGLPTDAAVHFERVLKRQPAALDAHNNLAVAYLNCGRVADAIIQWQEALKLDAQCIFALENLSWVLATCPDASMRNGREALALAALANKLSGGRDSIALRNLAAAYAECGQFDDAITTARLAVTLADAAGAAQLQKQIQSYQSGLPLRDESLAAP